MVSVYCTLRLGVDVIFQDADVVWFRDPRPFFLLEADGTASNGHGKPRVRVRIIEVDVRFLSMNAFNHFCTENSLAVLVLVEGGNLKLYLFIFCT